MEIRSKASPASILISLIEIKLNKNIIRTRLYEQGLYSNVYGEPNVW